jgi:hypothetical protein
MKITKERFQKLAGILKEDVNTTISNEEKLKAVEEAANEGIFRLSNYEWKFLRSLSYISPEEFDTNDLYKLDQLYDRQLFAKSERNR